MTREEMVWALEKTLAEKERLVVTSKHKGNWNGGWIITITNNGSSWVHKWGLLSSTLRDEYRRRVSKTL